MNDLIIQENDLIDNPTARVPICLVLDTSFSMAGEPILELNKGVQMFFSALRSDEIAQYSAEVSIVTFGGEAIKLLGFDNINNQQEPHLTVNGLTPMGEGVTLALDLLEERKKEYSNAGVDYYQPWMVLMTDGGPNGNSAIFNNAVKRTCQLVSSRKLTIFPIGIGGEADMGTLSEFSPSRPPLKLKGLNFNEFFEWLSQSVSKVSQSTPGEKVELDLDGIKGWAEL